MSTPPSRWFILPLLSLAACSLSTSDFTFDGGGAGAAQGGAAGGAGATAGASQGGAGQAGTAQAGAGQGGGGAGQAGKSGAGQAGAGQSGASGAGQAGAGQSGASGAGQAGASGAGQAGAGQAGASGAGQAGQAGASGAGQAGAGGAAPCNPGDKRCNGLDIESCVGGVFTKESTCVAGGACVVPQGGAPTCANCKPDEGKCAGATLLRCTTDGAGFALVDSCAGATPICDEKGDGGKGECDKCVPDAFQCVGPILFKCSATGQSLILSKDCGTDALCDATAGVCKTEVCKAGDRKCSNDTPLVCDTSKNDFVADGPACKPGLCNPASSQCFACNAGEHRCDTGDQLQVCASDRSAWSTLTQCPAGKCDATAKTCSQCTAGSRTCVGQSIVECLGGSFTPGNTITTCAPGQICDPLASQCDVCQSGAFRCDGASLKQCDADGQSEVTKATCASAALCDAGAEGCKACLPGSYRCTGASLQVCAGDGSGFATTQTCASAALCDAPGRTCQMPACALGQQVCTSGNKVGECRTDLTGFTYSPCPPDKACVPGDGCQAPESLAAGGAHACATLGVATLCWGSNQSGQCGASPVTAIAPTTVKTASGKLFTKAYSLVAGYAHTCAVQDGKAHCWGSNEFGQLGVDSSTQFSETPVEVPSLPAVTWLAAGGHGTCAVTADNELYCWGRNDTAQLGLGFVSTSEGPTKVAGILGTPTEISMSALTTCAVAPMGSLNNIWCWGDNSWGQAGVVGTPLKSPQQMLGFTAEHVVTSTDGASAVTCGHSGEKTFCWGSNGHGEQGTGASGPSTTSPGEPAIGISDVASVSSASGCTCAATSGKTWCWGHCAPPQMAGATSGTSFPTPIQLGNSQVFSRISMGLTWGCGMRPSTGALFCWGANNLQQLGSAGPAAPVPRAVVFP